MLEARGTFRLSDDTGRRTSGLFGQIMSSSMPTFERHFGEPLFPGSLNVTIDDPPDLMEAIRRAALEPEVTIPRSELAVPVRHTRIGEHRFWPAFFVRGKIPSDVLCWLMRKEGTGLQPSHHEILSAEGLAARYDLRNGDPFILAVGAAKPAERS